jgi:hypothetical protein
MTKWQKFAQSKGIKSKSKRDKKVYDEETKVGNFSILSYKFFRNGSRVTVITARRIARDIIYNSVLSRLKINYSLLCHSFD